MFLDWFFNALRKEDELKKLRLECFCHKARAGELMLENRHLTEELVDSEAKLARLGRENASLERELNEKAAQIFFLKVELKRCERDRPKARKRGVKSAGIVRRGE